MGSGILAYLLFFLPQHVEEAVEGFTDNIFVEIEFVRDRAAAGSSFDDLIVFLNYPTCSIEVCTMGVKAVVRSAELVRLK